MWIIFEGCDGSGKTTLASNVSERLSRLGYSTVQTREPGSPHDAACATLRDVIMQTTTERDALLPLFLADRVQHENKVVLPALGRGSIVLQDRGQLSTLVYQVLTETDKSERHRKMLLCDMIMAGRRVSDLLVIADVDEDVVRHRLDNRAVLNELDKMPEPYGIYRDLINDWTPLCAVEVSKSRMAVKLNTREEGRDAVELVVEHVLYELGDQVLL